MSPIIYSIAPRYTEAPTELVGFFVAPNGSASNDGTQGSPWDLSTALAGASGRITPGSTVWLADGTYFKAGGFSSTSGLAGSNPFGERDPTGKIHFKPVPGARVIISDCLHLDSGHDFWFWDVEVVNTNINAQDQLGIDCHAPRVGFIRVWAKNHCSNGFGNWSEAIGSFLESCVAINCGINATGSAAFAAHGIYAQNAPTNPIKKIYNCAAINNFGYGIHVYGQETGTLENFDLQNILSYGNGVKDGYDFQVGGGTALKNVTLRNCWSYRGDTTARFGYSAISTSLDVQNCMFLGQVYMLNLGQAALIFRNNMIAQEDTNSYLIQVQEDQAPNYAGWDINLNQYKQVASPSLPPFVIVDRGTGTEYNFVGWKSVMADEAGSTFATGTDFGTRTSLSINTIDQKSAKVMIHNPTLLTSVPIDLSPFLAVGDSYTIKHDYNWATVVASGTYAGGTVNFPMTGHTPPAYLAGTPTNGFSPPNLSQRMSSFLVLKN